MGQPRGREGIFISYRREETAANAGRLYDHLSDHFGEDHVFMDVDSIAIGTDFIAAIADAVSECDILLVLIGRDWTTITDSKGKRRIDDPDDFVRVEIETALQRDIPVVPILVDGAELLEVDELPPSLRPLVRRQALELSHTGYRSQVTRLVSAIDEVLRDTASRSATPPKTSLHSKQRSPLPASQEERDSPLAESATREPLISDVGQPALTSADWKVDRVEKEKYRRRLFVSRREQHEIEYIVDKVAGSFASPELLKLDGEIIDTYKSTNWRGEWPFSFLDGGEEAQAKVTAHGNWRCVITRFELEIDGTIIYND